jgi:predicted nucleic acid-binding protein
MTVFIDTSAILAILNENDLFHPRAKENWIDLNQRKTVFVTNNYVLLETYALLQNRFGKAAVILFNASVLPVLYVSWVSEELHSRALSAMLAADSGHLSLVDCSCFETMRETSIDQVFTFDQDFAGQGFVLIPEPN